MTDSAKVLWKKGEKIALIGRSEIDREKIGGYQWNGCKPNHVPVEEGIHEFSKLSCNEISQNTIEYNLGRPENKRSFGEQVEVELKFQWRTEPFHAARWSDDLSKEVKS